MTRRIENLSREVLRGWELLLGQFVMALDEWNVAAKNLETAASSELERYFRDEQSTARVFIDRRSAEIERAVATLACRESEEQPAPLLTGLFSEDVSGGTRRARAAVVAGEARRACLDELARRGETSAAILSASVDAGRQPDRTLGPDEPPVAVDLARDGKSSSAIQEGPNGRRRSTGDPVGAGLCVAVNCWQTTLGAGDRLCAAHQEMFRAGLLVWGNDGRARETPLSRGRTEADIAKEHLAVAVALGIPILMIVMILLLNAVTSTGGTPRPLTSAEEASALAAGAAARADIEFDEWQARSCRTVRVDKYPFVDRTCRVCTSDATLLGVANRNPALRERLKTELRVSDLDTLRSGIEVCSF